MRKLLVILLLLSFGVSFAAEQHAPRGPIIVAKRSFIDQAGDIATTTIFKVRRDGLYRISLYATNTGCCIPAFHLFWTDESGAELAGEGPTISAFPPITALGSQGSASGGQIVMHCLAGTKIQLNDAVDQGQANYNVFVTVEML